MKLVAFESGNVHLVKSTATALTVFFSLCKLLESVSAMAKLNFFWHLNSDFLTIILGGRLPET